VTSFAYPYGNFSGSDDSAAEALKAAGCRVAYTGVKGVVHGQSDAFRLPRAHFNRRVNFAWAYNVQEALDHSRQEM
jgi:hypothetical protein